MNVNIICVGKIKESFYQEAIKEYSRRISRFCTLAIQEVADEPIPDKASEKVMDSIREKEGRKLSALIKPGSFTICLDLKGKTFDSEQFAAKFSELTHVNSTFNFIIGGSIGLDPALLSSADMKLSFSKFTFPHQLMRVIMLEQLYRWFKILGNETYHK